MNTVEQPKGKLVQLILGLLAVIIIAGIVITEWQGKDLLAPTPEAVFEGHQKVSEDSALRMTFPDKMDEVSLKENMEMPVEGDVSWEGRTMVLKPKKALAQGETYTFVAARNSKYASGTPLNKDLTFRFTVAGAPVVSSHYPSTDAIGIATDSKINLVFDRPMIPLSVVQGEGAKKYAGDWPVTISPEVNGEWRWLGTSTVSFVPADGLVPATAYHVKVPKGIVSANGDTTTEDYSWSFETVRPMVLASDPYAGYNLNGPKTEITLTFNQEMKLENAIEFIRLVKTAEIPVPKTDPNFKGQPLNMLGEPENLSFDLKYGFDQIDEQKKIENRNKLVIVPVKPLEWKTMYRVIAKPDLKAAKGDLGTVAEYTADFSTVGELKVKESKFEENYLRIVFSNPINDETLKGNILIDPKPEGWDEIEFTTNQWSEEVELLIYANFKPSTAYNISFADKVKDQFGQGFIESYAYSFTTPALKPQLNILSKGEFGIFEKDKPPVYSFETVNLSKINLEMARVPFDQFIQLRQNIKSTWDYQPNMQGYIGYATYALPTNGKLNDKQIINFDIEKEKGGALIPGVYAMRVQAPEYVDTYNHNKPIIQYQYFSLTANALTLKYSGNNALVWLVSMKTGEPVADADITFYNLGAEKVIEGKTDKDGFFETRLDLKKYQTANNEWRPEFWVTASKDGDFTFLGSNWNSGLEPWNFSLNEDFRDVTQKEYILDAYLYSERQVYRPGDTVHFKGITRLRDKNGAVSIPKNLSVLLTVQDAEYKEIYKKTLNLNEFGTVSGDLTLGKEASLGNYFMNLSLMPDDRMERNNKGYSFYVLEYRKPEYKVEVKPEKTDYFSGDQITFDVSGDYYFGAPMNGATVNWTADMSDYWFNRYTDGWYSFALEDSWCWWNCNSSVQNLTTGTGTLDAKGNLKVTFPVNLDDKATSQMVTLNADITDPNNQVVSNRETVPVHKADVYVGVQMENYAVTPGENAKVKIVTVNPDGTAKPGSNVTVSLYLREWNTIKKKNVDGYYYYENEPKDTYIRKTSVTTDTAGKATAELLIKDGGTYRVVAEAADSKGRIAKAGAYVYGFSDTYINWPHTNNDRIDVVVDRPEYKVGDTAKLLIKSPYQGKGVKALITVERENVVSRQIIDVLSNAQPFEVKITEDMIPNTFVSAIVIKPRDGETFDEEGNDTGMPGFKIGYAKLKVETSHKVLSIKLDTDKQKYGPGETVTATIETIDYNGNPVQSEVSLGVVDLSVQALLGFQLPDLIMNFYEERGLGVQTSQMLTYLIEAFKPGSKGGGGGGAETKARTEFKDTAYWNAGILTDENGKATVSFKLPDNLTTWQLLAIGSSKDHQYGSVVREVIETKKTIVRPLRPRFAVEGDQINVGATVHNFTDQTQNYKVTLDGDGFAMTGEKEQILTVKSDEMAKVIFPITVDPVTELKFHFKAQGEGAVDEITEAIPVYEFGTLQSVATTGYTEKEITEKIYVPSSKEARRGTVTTTISPTLASYLPKGLEYLVKFPYGCAEQTVSSFLPNVALKSLQNFDAFKIADDKKLETNILGGLQRLYGYQRGDGGFGYWNESTESYPYLTAYIVYALNMTQKAGYAVDGDVLVRANDYLQSVLRNQDLTKKLDLATRAYILYVMSENGKSDLALANNLYEKRADLPLFSRAYLAMTYGSGEKAKKLLQEIIDQVKIDARGAHFEEKDENYWIYTMNTNNRTNAIVLQAMIRQMPDHDLIPKLVRYMLDAREEGHWDTTQSTVASLFTLVEFLKDTNEMAANYKADVKIDGTSVITKEFDKNNILTKEEVVKTFEDLGESEYADMSLSKEGDGRLYYDISMDYFLTQDQLLPTDQGIGITRTITPLDETEKGFSVQGTYKTKLTITVPEDRNYVAISSPLPAGMEPIDFTIQTNQQQLADEINQPKDGEENYWWNPMWYFNHTEFRDDEIFLFADYLPAGVYEYEYLTRATTAGKFRERPARAWEMYYPETFGQTSGDWFEIKE